MRTLKATHTVGGLALALASATLGCNPMPPPPLTVASAAQAKLSLFVDPEVAVAEARDERGRELLAPFRDAVAAAFNDAGYHVVPAATAAHDLTIHVKVARVGFAYGPWADGVVLEILGGDGQVLGKVARSNLNFVHLEGADTAARLRFAAHELVNSVGRQPMVDYASSHVGNAAPASNGAPSSGTGPAPSGGSPPSAAVDASPK